MVTIDQTSSGEFPPPTVKETVRLSSARRAIAQRMVESKQQAPHFYASTEVDMGRVVEVRAGAKQAGHLTPSVNDFFLWACVAGLIEQPILNSRLDGDRLTVFSDINLGMVTAVDDKIVVPVVRAAQHMTVAEIASHSRELANRARTKRLTPADCEGGTFSVSNLGMFGVDRFVAILNPGQAAILAVGSVESRVVVRDGAPAVREVATATVSVDHRIADGVAAARFLSRMKRALESFPGEVAA